MRLSSLPIDFIDLDAGENENLGAQERILQMHLTVCYLLGSLSNSDLISLKVFIGLLPPIPLPDQKALPALTLEIAGIGLTCTDTSVLMKAIMIMEEIKRIFSLSEQLTILSELRRRKI